MLLATTMMPEKRCGAGALYQYNFVAGLHMMATPASNGYCQTRPFTVCVAGPSNRLCEDFLSSLRRFLESPENATNDTIINDVDPGCPTPKNYFKVRRELRKVGQGRVVYTITWDSLILQEDISRRAPCTHVDAYVLLYDDTDETQFNALQSRHMDHVLRLCQADSWGPKKAIMVAAHHSRVFGTRLCYPADELEKLVRRSHAIFRRANFTVAAQCHNAIDVLVGFLVDVHSDYQLSQTRSRALYPSSSHATMAPSWISLDALFGALQDVQRSVFPQCGQRWSSSSDPDEPRAMTPDERALHCVQATDLVTPMGARAGD